MREDTISKNLELMRRTLQAFSEGDINTLSQVFSNDIVWHVPGRSNLAQSYRGQAEVFGFFGRLMEKTLGTFRVESLEMYANERGGCFVDRITAQRDERLLDVRLILEVKIRDGQIVEGFDHFHNEHLWDAFWDD